MSLQFDWSDRLLLSEVIFCPDPVVTYSFYMKQASHKWAEDPWVTCTQTNNDSLKVDWTPSCPGKQLACWRILLSHQEPGSSWVPSSSAQSSQQTAEEEEAFISDISKQQKVSDLIWLIITNWSPVVNECIIDSEIEKIMSEDDYYDRS